LGGRVALASAILLGPLTSWFIIRSFLDDYPSSIFMGMLNIVAIALTIGGIVSLPLFIASTAARSTVSYVRSQEYPLLCVTALPDGKIVNGHVLAILRHARAPLILMLGLAPAFSMMLAYFVWQFTTFYFTPWAWYDGTLADTDLGVFGIVLKHAVITITLGLGLLGINLLASALGVGFGLWWRSAAPSATAALATTVGSTLMIAYGVRQVAAFLDVSDMFLRHLIQYGMLAPIPYLLAFCCMRLARRWARKPS
jgi:hypothetical protein